MARHLDLTMEYYASHADEFFESTVDADMSQVRDRFLHLLPRGGTILDFGCGSGRDSKAFIEAGYSVTALDGSRELSQMAENLIQKPVICCRFQEFRASEKYDGIWACASLLHLTEEELRLVLKELVNALNPEGVLYMSFKYGDFTGVRNGRWFIDINETRLNEIMSPFSEIQLCEQWITNDVRPNKPEKWINNIYRKTAAE